MDKINDFKSYFDALSLNSIIQKDTLLKLIKKSGILLNDQRFGKLNENSLMSSSLEELPDEINDEIFYEFISSNTVLLNKIFDKDLIISNWEQFCKDINEIYLATKDCDSGKVAGYIPQLAKVSDKLYGVSVCSIDGQQHHYGDVEHHFCVQSCSKPITYLIATDLNNSEYVHNFIGREPSGKNFNELCLNSEKIPHNPLINSGAIMAASLVNYRDAIADRFDTVMEYWSKLAGNTKINFSNSVYLSERTTADRNFCLGYMMQESLAFSQGKDKKFQRDWNNNDLQDSLDFYFQCCSIEITCKQAGIIAATLANGGICPVTNERVFSPDIVKNALSLMSSCGMYDYSGEWAYTIGIPAKSGVSGIIMGIIPNVMGIAVFSPKLDEIGNSAKGIEFFKKLTTKYSFHAFDNVLNTKKKAVINNDVVNEELNLYRALTAASNGDINSIRAIYAKGYDLNIGDYDGRTALHLAASEGELEIVEFLLSKKVNKMAKDRWANTAFDDAMREKENCSTSLRNNYEKIIAILR